MGDEFQRAVHGKRYRVLRRDELGEHERLRQEIAAFLAFATEVESAWHEQERGEIEHGLRSDEVDAIRRRTAWRRYDLAHAQWRYAVRIQPGLPPPEKPECFNPRDADVPCYPGQAWDTIAASYLAWCRRRAGMSVVGRPAFYDIDPYGGGKR